jgi:hypothetical protein
MLLSNYHCSHNNAEVRSSHLMNASLLIGNAKSLSDTFVSVGALSECKSADTIQSVYEELEYVLNQSDYYQMTILFGKFCSGNLERIFLVIGSLD